MARKRYKTIVWHDPIWETQDKEPSREAHYKDLFLHYNGTITDFANEYLPQLWENSRNNHGTLTDFFDNYDIRKGMPPSYNTIEGWSRYFYWKVRRDAFKNSISEETRQALKDTRVNLLKDYIFNLKKVVPESLDAQLGNIQRLNEVLLGDDVNGHMVKSHTEAHNNLEDYLHKALGLDETVSNADDLNENNVDDVIPVPDDPAHENKELHDELNNILWDMVNQK